MIPASYQCTVEWCYPATFAWTLSAGVSFLLFQRSCLSSHYALVGLAHILDSTSVIKFKATFCSLLLILLVCAVP